jgi:hypothetical protein
VAQTILPSRVDMAPQQEASVSTTSRP